MTRLQRKIKKEVSQNSITCIKAFIEIQDDDDDQDTFVREEVFKVKVFEMRHEAFRTIFEERYFFYLLPNKKNNGPRKTVKNMKGDLAVSLLYCDLLT